MPAVAAKGISKRYYINDAKTRSFREALAGIFRFGSSGPAQELWVLRDIDFSIDEGETLGIIGRNGAGKSTLLKILSRITKPTLGRAEINGRVGSLLEVGTGFHSELSGRENIFLNGAILGMRRTEIQKKFDEIVAFSEIEKFLDTPVKHYSSGMYMRLAFAVAAHLEPEVLIVDEVLAVGDAMFQKKCLAKMHDVSEEGRTVIFVSHDLNAVTRLCRKVIWLDSGRLKLAGDAGEVTSAYLFEQELTGSERIWNETDAPGNEVARLLRVRAVDENNNTSSAFEIGKEVWIEMTYDVLQSDKVLIPNVHFFNAQGYCLFVSHDWHGGWRDRPRPRGRYVSKVRVPNNFLTEGPLHIGAALTTYSPLEVHFVEWNAISFNMIDNGDDPNSTRGDFTGEIPGVIRPLLDWETEFSG